MWLVKSVWKVWGWFAASWLLVGKLYSSDYKKDNSSPDEFCLGDGATLMFNVIYIMFNIVFLENTLHI